MSIQDTRAASIAEVRLQSILETAYDAYVSMDDRGRITDWNRKAEVTFGFARQEAVGRVLAETIIPPRYRDAHWRGLDRFLTTGEGPVLNRCLQLTALHRDGHEFPMEMTIWPLREGQSWSFHAIVRDISELREAQQRALAVERQAAVGRLISALTGEGSNALQQIQMASDLLTLAFQEHAKALEHVALIQQAQERLDCLFKEIHGYAIPLQLKRNVWNMQEIWQEALAPLTPLRQARDVSISERAATTDLTCLVDRTGMEQVFRIVLQDSLTRCLDPVRIEIFCCDGFLERRPAIRITLRDNGPGLPRESWQQMLGLANVERTGDPASELAIAARIVDAHGGRISASDALTQGTEFVIVLPRGE